MDGHPFKLALNVTAQSCQWANQASQIASYYIPKSVPTPQSETNQPSERDKWWSVANQLNWRLGELRSSMFYYLGDKWRRLWCSHWQPNIKERPNNTSTEICQTVVPISPPATVDKLYCFNPCRLFLRPGHHHLLSLSSSSSSAYLCWWW